MQLNNRWIKTGALMAALAVVLGAFGAHGLDGFLADKYAGQFKTVVGQDVPAAVKYLDNYKTAAHYHMIHALGIVFVGLLMAHRPRRSLQIAAWCFFLGVVIFSGSLYFLTLTGHGWLGAITPIGGVLFVLGWLALVEGACPGRNPRQPNPTTLESGLED